MPKGKQWLECLGLAIAYFLTARLGQTLSIDPGNVTPVWIPSGIILAALVLRGPYLWPGIWLGAFIGNVWAYIDFQDIGLLIRATLTGTSNGIGDALCGLIGYWAVTGRGNKAVFPHQSTQGTWSFVIGAAIAGSLVSAVFGVGALAGFGFIEVSAIATTGLTWWAGDAIGVMLVGSTLLVIFAPSKGLSGDKCKLSVECVLFWVAVVVASIADAQNWEVLGLFPFPRLLILPILAWSAFRLSVKTTYLATFSVGVVEVVFSVLYYGPKSGVDLNALLIEQQVFIGITFLTIMLLTSVIYQYRRTEEALIDVRDEALKASSYKSRFLAAMSHDIRTPINGVVGATELLVNTELTDEQARHARTIEGCCDHLMLLTQEILDMSLIENDRLDLKSTAFSVNGLMDSQAAMFTETAKQKGIRFECELEPEVPAALEGDEFRIRQILVNLIANAVKFTDAGYVRLRISHSGGTTHFEVHDTGIGIAEKELTGVFEEFEQADHTTVAHGGSGLGLYISQRLARLMKGEITAESTLGKGSTFVLSLPLPPAEVIEESKERVAETSVSSEAAKQAGEATKSGQRRMLIVEDNLINQQLSEVMLTKHQIQVTTANDGVEALEILKTKCFDAILMDCRMPNLDGFETTERIRAMDNELARIPIIGLTANATREDCQRCLDVGMNEVLTKPVTREVLCGTVDKYL